MNLESMYQGICQWWSRLDEDDRARRLHEFGATFAYNSARIEDRGVTRHDTREVFATGRVTGYTGALSTLYAIQDQKDAWAKVLGDVDRGRPFDEGLVLEAQQTLTWGTYSQRQLADGERPGSYRLGEYLIADAAEVGAAAAEVPGLVRDLCDEVAGALGNLTPKRALTVAAYFHTTFETIHPFSDGSGLAGRELMNYVLLSGGHPPVVIFDEDRQAYYEALEHFNAEGDLVPFKRLLMVETIKTWRDAEGPGDDA